MASSAPISPPRFAHFTAAFREGLAEAGFIEGKNVAIEFRLAEQRLERVPALAMDLVRRQVAVIFTADGDVPAMVAKGATSTIPIVFVTGFDPVKTGLVASLNRPSGNVTGATVIASQLAAKRLELLRELAPRARVIAMMANPSNPNAEPDFAEARLAARALGQEIHMLSAGTEHRGRVRDFGSAGALLIGRPIFHSRRGNCLLAVRSRLPAIYNAATIRRRRLISYGASCLDPYRQAASTPAILKGQADRSAGRAADQVRAGHQSKTAKALGLNPALPAARADEVIE